MVTITPSLAYVHIVEGEGGQLLCKQQFNNNKYGLHWQQMQTKNNLFNNMAGRIFSPIQLCTEILAI